MPTYKFSDVGYPQYTRLIINSQNRVHDHNFWEFSIVIQGNSINHYKNNAQELSFRNVLLLRPFDSHSIEIAPSSSPYLHRDIYVSDQKMQTVCNLISPTYYDYLKNSKSYFRFDISSPLLNHIEDFAMLMSTAAPENADISETLHSSVILSLLGALRAYESKPSAHPGWLTKLIYKMTIPDNFQYKIDEIVEDAGYSHGHVCRKFKEFTGKTVREFFNEQKMNYATYLLANSNMKVIEIANILGYSSSKNFVIQFEETYNTPPSSWRKQNLLVIKT